MAKKKYGNSFLQGFTGNPNPEKKKKETKKKASPSSSNAQRKEVYNNGGSQYRVGNIAKTYNKGTTSTPKKQESPSSGYLARSRAKQQEQQNNNVTRRYQDLTANRNNGRRLRAGNSFLTSGRQTGVETKRLSRLDKLTVGTARQIVGGYKTALNHDSNEYNEFKKSLDDMYSNGKIDKKTYQENLDSWKRSSTKYAKYKDWEKSEQHKRFQQREEEGKRLQARGDKQVAEGMKGLKGGKKMAAEAYTSGLGMLSDMALGPAWAAGMATRTMGNSLNETRDLVDKGVISEREAENNAGLQALKEVGTEYMFQGAGLASKLTGAGKLAEKLTRAKDIGIDTLTSRISNATLRNAVASGVKFASGAAEEAAEEFVGGVLDAPITNAAYAGRLDKNFRSGLQGSAGDIAMQRDSLVKQGYTKEEANAVYANEIGSADFLSNLTDDYIKSGMGSKDADKQAKLMQEYLNASLNGDQKTMSAIEDKMAKGIKSEFSLSDTLEAMGSAGLMAAVTGLPGAVGSYHTGAAVKAQLEKSVGVENAAKAITKRATTLSDDAMAARAQAMYDHATNGGEIANEQYYELARAIQVQNQENENNAAASRSAAANVAGDERYIYQATQNMNAQGELEFGSYDGENFEVGGITNDRANSLRSEVRGVIKDVEKVSDELNETDKHAVTEAIVALELGYPTADAVEYFTTANPENRQIYEEVTGKTLPKSNAEVRNFLFSDATRNYVESARLETVDTIDKRKGQYDVEFANTLGGNGQQVLHGLTDKIGIENADDYVAYNSVLAKAYDSGMKGIPLDTVYALADSYNIGRQDAEDMYNAGVQDGNSNFKEGTAVFDLSDKSNLKNSDREFALAVARAFNVNIVVRDNLTPDDADKAQGKESRGNNNQVNGFYLPSTNTIYLNYNSSIETNVGYTVMHELTHSIKARSPKEYQAFAKKFEDRAIEKLGAEEFNNLVNSKIELYKGVGQNLSREAAIEEILSDQMGEVLHDEEFINQLAEEEPSLARALLDGLRDILRKIRELFAIHEGFVSKYNEATLSELDMLKDAEKLLVNAIKQAQDRRTQETLERINGEVEASFSLRNKNLSITSRVPYIENGDYVSVSNGDKAQLQKLQDEVRSLKRGTYENKATGYRADINGNTIGKILNPGKGFNAFSDRYINNLNAATHLSSLFENAVYIDTKAPQKSKNVGKQIQGYHHFVAPLRMDGQEFRVRIVAREKQNSDTLYIVDAEVIKKGGSSVGRSKASQFVSIPSDVSISDLVNGVKIFDYSSQKNDNYNVQDIRFSIPETDSSGNTLSDGQREYFNDSKVVDENGNLRVVYHGTQNAGFTVFKRTNNFYTSSREVANSYTNKGGVYEGYLNITNPLEIDCNNERWSRIETDQIDSAITDLFKEYGASTFEEDDAERTSTADIISVVEDAIEDKALDYDGVIFKNIYDEGMFGNHETGTLLSDVYVTFNSNQFKNRDNLEPTDNPDIRFSIEPGMSDEERYNELKDKNLNVVVSEKQNLPLTDKEFESLKAKKLSDAKKAAMKLAKDLNITKVYSSKDIDFEFEYTNRGIEESAQKQFSTRGKGKYINFINLQLNLGAVIDNAELIKVYTDKEYVGENKGHEENENLRHSYVLVSAFADEENIVPVKLTVMGYVDHANPKLRVAITYETIKKSEIIADRLIKSRESATPTSMGVSLADVLPKINDETLKKHIPPQFYNQESYSFSGTVVSEEDIDNPVDEDMYYADDYAMAKRVKIRDEIRAELENLTRDETKLTHGTILNGKSVNKELKQLVNVLMKGSTNLASERRENLEFVNDAAKKLWYMVQSGGGLTNLTAEQKLEISKLAAKVGQEVVSNTRFVDEQLYREGKELRDYFRSTPIRVRDNIKSDINWKDDYKKKNFGRMKLVSENYQGNAYDIDELWQELLESVPAFKTFAPSEYGSLDDIIDESEMFMAIDAALDNTYEVEDVYASDCAQEIELQFAQDFMRAVLKNGEAWQSFADKKKAQYDTNLALLKERQKEAVRDLRRRHAERLNDKLRAEKKKSNERLAKQKARYDEKAEKEKTKRNEQKEKTRSYKARMKSWGHIESNYNYLQKKLLNPKKEEGQNIPEALRKPLAEVLAEFDLQTERSAKLEEKRGRKAISTAKLDKLKSALERVASEDGSKDFMCHSSLFRTLSDLSESLDGKPLRDLSNEDLSDIDDMLSQIKHMIASQNKLFREGRKQDVASAGEQIIKDMNAKIKKYKRGYSYTGLKGAVKHVFNEDMMTPMDFFDSLGGQMNDMYKNLRLAQDDYIRKVKYLSDFVDDTFSKFSKKSKIRKRPKPGGEIEEWSNEKSAKTFTLSSGEQIRLSAAQMMSLYCLSTREQAMSHILGSGIVISDISPKKRTEKVLGAKVDNTATAVHLTYNDVVEIVGQLTDDQRQIADKLQGLMNGELQNWGNETSMQLYGVRLFKEENYFPIEVEGAYLDGKIGEASGINGNRITSFGFTKPLTENASNPIVVGDIFDIFTAHANKMALYSSYAAALTDFNRVFNYKQRFEDGRLGRSVKGMITDAFGGRSINFIDNFLNDINGQAETRMDGIGEVINATLARYKKAAIGLNVRVLVQQPTAIVRSLYYLSPKYFTPNVYWRPGKAKKEMHEHCPIAYWKAEGNYQNDYTRSLKDQIFNRWSNFENISMGFYGLADDMTWAVIWNACKNKVKAEHKDVKVGSEEFYVLCNEVASEVFDRTQVVDSVFHRSDAMRSKNGITKMSSSFMAEPTRTYNMLRSSVVKARRLSMDGHKGQAIKELSKVGMVLIFNAAAVSAAAAVIDAFRGKGDDDDDEEFFETWLRNFGENFLDNASPLQQVVFVKDISELIVGAWTGDSYGNSNMAYEGWEKLANGFAEVQDVFSGDLDFFSWLSGDFGAGLGYVTGVPAYNFIRDARALWKKMGWDVFADDGIEASDEESDSENSGSGSGHRTVKDYAKGAAKSALGIGDGDTTPSDVQAMAEQYGIETGSGESSSKKKGVVDKVLESFGIKRDPKSKAKRAFNKEVKSIEKKTKDLSGEEKAKKVNDLAMDGYTNLVDAGDIKGLKHMRKVIEKAGGDVEAFDKSVSKKLSTAYKKTIGTDDIDKREKIKNYLLENGWTEYKISREIVAKSDVAKEYKAAARKMDHDAMVDALVPLIEAGLTETDCYNLFKNRNRGNTETYSDGKYENPIDGGTLTSAFGYRSAPTAGASSYHEGIDIGVALGTVVGAADGGEVIYTGYKGGYGNQIIVRHDDGSETYYSHLDNISVRKGQRVSKKQYIGNVGSTGTSTGPHLDFRIKVNGEYVDPLSYFSV